MLSLSRQLAWAAQAHTSASPQRPPRLHIEQLLAGAPDPYRTPFTRAGVQLITVALRYVRLWPTGMYAKWRPRSTPAAHDIVQPVLLMVRRMHEFRWEFIMNTTSRTLADELLLLALDDAKGAVHSAASLALDYGLAG